MKNRHGVEYSFESIGDNLVKFVMDPNEMSYCRFGGQEGQSTMDWDNLGFFDPPGGPLVSVGSTVNGRKIKKISANNSDILMELE